MANVLLSPQAERDLDDIWDYIAERNPLAAFRLLGEINGTFELIASFPDIGRVREDLKGKPRIFVVRRYVIVYQATDLREVEILRVYHAARDLGRL